MNVCGKRIAGIIIFMCFAAFLTGCSQEEIYRHAVEYQKETVQKLSESSNRAGTYMDDSLEDMDGWLDDTAKEGSKYLSDASKKAGIFIIVGSLSVGVLLLILCSRTKTVKLYKTAWMVFIIGIPALTIVAIYGLAFLAGWFM